MFNEIGEQEKEPKPRSQPQVSPVGEVNENRVTHLGPTFLYI